MAYTYTTRDGQRCEIHVNAALNALDAAFYAKFGKRIKITTGGGTRTKAEQEGIFYSRYRAQATGSGPYGDVRVYKGIRYVRVSGAGTVAVPGTSNHEEDGPRGPRAVDIHDTGSDRGVTTAGTVRANWIRANAAKYGFNPAGYGFGEPWHIEYTGSLSGGTSTGGSSTSNPKFSQTVLNEQAWLNKSRGEKLVLDGLKGGSNSNTTAAIKRYQQFLKDHYGYTGKIDGDWGAGTQASHQKYYDDYNKPATPTPAPSGARPVLRKGSKGDWVKKLQHALNTKYPAYSKLKEDGDFGNATDKVVRELQKRAKLKVDGVVGNDTWKWL